MKELKVRVPDTLHDQLKALAASEHRSINAQVTLLIEQAVQGQDRSDSPPP
jgi:hypothetical protein